MVSSCASKKNKMSAAKENTALEEVVSAFFTPPFYTNSKGDTIPKILKSEKQWKSELDPKIYPFLRQAAIEPKGSSPYLGLKDEGLLACKGCGMPLFDTKDIDKDFDDILCFKRAYDPMTLYLPEGKNPYRPSRVYCGRCGAFHGLIYHDSSQRIEVNSIGLEFIKAEN